MKYVPRYQYDCYRCKFSWNCGPTCACVRRDLPDPPVKRMREVNVARIAEGLDPEFNQAPLTWYQLETLTADVWVEEPVLTERTIKHRYKELGIISHMEILTEKIQ